MKKLVKGLTLSLFCLLAGWTAYIANNGNGVNQDVELSDVEALAIAGGEGCGSDEDVIPCWAEGYGVLCRGKEYEQCPLKYYNKYTGKIEETKFNGTPVEYIGKRID